MLYKSAILVEGKLRRLLKFHWIDIHRDYCYNNEQITIIIYINECRRNIAREISFSIWHNLFMATFKEQNCFLHIVFLFPSAGTPATQVHDSPQGFFWLFHLLSLHFARNHSRRGRRKLLCLWQRSNMAFHTLLSWLETWIPSAETLVLQSLHNSNTNNHSPRSSLRWTHL